MKFSFKVGVGLAGTVAAAGMLVIPASGAGAAPRVGAVSSKPGTAASVPGTTIKGNHSTATFKPSKLDTKWSGPTAKTCTKSEWAITVTNSTKSTEKVTYKGQEIGALPAGTSSGICFWGSGTQTFSFGLKGSSGTLAVTVS